MFEVQSKDEIQKRMAADLSTMNPNSTIEGSFGRDVITPPVWNLRKLMQNFLW